MSINQPSENNPSQQVDSPLLRGKSSATKPSPLIREYPQSGGGLLVPNSDSQRNRGGLLLERQDFN